MYCVSRLASRAGHGTGSLHADSTAVHSAVHMQPGRLPKLGSGVQVIICGAELFTSNAAMLPAALYEGRVTLQQLLRNWGIAYTGEASTQGCWS